MSSVPERSEIDEEYKWSIDSIYADDEAWEEAYEDVEERLDDLRAYEGRATESAATLRELLDTYEAVFREVSKVTSYARLRSNEDTRDQEYQAMSSKAQALSAEASSASSYLEPELQELDRSDIEDMIDEEPALAEYEHFFDDVLRMKPHTRSAEVEELLADLSEVTGAASEAYSMLSDADMTFPTVEDPEGDEVEISQGNFTTLLQKPDREFRRRVHEEFYSEWETVRNTVGTTLAKSVKKDVKMAEARNYDTAREAALDGPNVPVEVYDTLVDTVRDNLDSLGRHADLKRRALDVDTLEMWDLYMSLTGDEGPDISYEEAKEHVVEAVAPLGEEYQQRMAEGLESRWVDVYENRGKRSGAYSAGTYDTQPFIMMNYQDDVSSMYTLAHELGHSMHSELSKEAQPWQYADYEIFVAEVASTVNETLLTKHLLENAESDELRAHALDQYLERFRSTLFRQTMFAAFEQAIHEHDEAGKPLTPDVFDELYGDLKAEFYGHADATVDEHIRREWMRIPHFYYNFYVYQYSTGISAAAAIVDRIEDEGEVAAEEYRAALRAGGAEYPIDVLDIAGIDMTESDPIESAIGVYDDYLDEAETLLDL
ncbi:oligoendopeptidase F [Halobaculum magnesiiphilum]|uniref:Oligoendopeptidase F n=1 Tax=Halobaculum magnesiiphilum TaxID=1017351 RepID=A0A8T8W8R1_9EURY|nr:oligoendopeptidase F [Halobaculum magnesiiphilum]QZP36211.1 oligoendopeptidase F [Halobaculum magnesiiphilum]